MRFNVITKTPEFRPYPAAIELLDGSTTQLGASANAAGEFPVAGATGSGSGAAAPPAAAPPAAAAAASENGEPIGREHVRGRDAVGAGMNVAVDALDPGGGGGGGGDGVEVRDGGGGGGGEAAAVVDDPWLESMLPYLPVGVVAHLRSAMVGRPAVVELGADVGRRVRVSISMTV